MVMKLAGVAVTFHSVFSGKEGSVSGWGMGDLDLCVRRKLVYLVKVML